MAGITKSPQDSINKAIELAKQAVASDETFAESYRFLSAVYLNIREYDKAIPEAERALDLDPNSAEVLRHYAWIQLAIGKADEAIPFFQKAIRLNPNAPTYFFWQYGIALSYKGRFDEAASAFKKAIQRAPKAIQNHVFLAATYSLMGRDKETRAEVEEVIKINPKFSFDHFKFGDVFKDKSLWEKNIKNPLLKLGLK